jgi:fructose-1,6-bisphosphatase II
MSSENTRHLALDLVRVTEAAAIAASTMMGRGDKNGADLLAVNAMRQALNSVDIQGTVVIGEGEKDEAPMLYIGEEVGHGHFVADIAVDPIDGTRLLSNGMPGSIAVIALAEKGGFHPVEGLYRLHKMATGQKAAACIDITKPVAWNIQQVAKAKDLSIENLTVAILERDHNQADIDAVRAAGARLKLFSDGDVVISIMTAMENSGVDLMIGRGGAPEGVISAAALTCLDGNIQCLPFCKSADDKKMAEAAGVDFDHVYTMHELASGENMYVAITGITSGELLDGVQYGKKYATTESLVLRSESGSIRRIHAQHRLDTLSN